MITLRHSDSISILIESTNTDTLDLSLRPVTLQDRTQRDTENVVMSVRWGQSVLVLPV